MSAQSASRLYFGFQARYDRHVTVRYHCDEPTHTHTGTSRSESRWARIRDVSSAGICLWISTPRPAGTQLSIHIKDRDSGCRRVHTACVVQCTDQGDGTWLLRCRFDKCQSADALRTLMIERLDPVECD